MKDTNTTTIDPSKLDQVQQDLQRIPRGACRRIRAGGGGALRVLSSPGIDVAALKNKFEADPEGASRFLSRMTDERIAYVEQRLEAERSGERPSYNANLDAWRLSACRDLPGLVRALAFDVQVPQEGPNGQRSMVTTEAFPLFVSGLMIAAVNEAYLGEARVSDMLYSEMDDVQKVSIVAGIVQQSVADLRKEEGSEYVHIGAGQEKFLIYHLPEGLQVTISQELFEENNAAGVEARWSALGRIGSHKIEERSIRRATDHDGSASSGAEPYLLHGPVANTGQAFFVTANTTLTRLGANGNRIVNTPLVTTEDLEKARVELAFQRDENGAPIGAARRPILLVPQYLFQTAFKLANSGLEPGFLQATNFFGPGGPGQPLVLASSYLDDLNMNGTGTTSNADVAWYYGHPQACLTRKWKLRPELVAYAGESTEAYVRSRTAARIRLGWDFECGASNYTGWLQMLKGSTAPADVS